MKKGIVLFITVIITFAITLGGCSCTSTTPLVFNDNFNAGTSASYPYKETLTYDVKYIKNYGTVFSKSEQITDDILKIDIVGTYTVTFEAIDISQTEKLSVIESDLLNNDLDVGSSIYHLHTELNLVSNYSSKNYIYQEKADTEPVKEIKDKEESIITDAYFLSSSLSFNPLYSKTVASTSFVEIASSSLAAVIFLEYEAETKYNKNDYVTTTKFATEKPTTQESAYTFRTAIDNNVLLFALRNINIQVEGNYILNVVSPSFEKPQSIKVINEEENQSKFNINENEETIKFKKYSFIRNVANATGFPQYALIQNDKTATLENKSLLLQYTASLNPNNSFMCLGGMQYTLKTVA